MLGMRLEDGHTLADYKIDSETTLHMRLVRLMTSIEPGNICPWLTQARSSYRILAILHIDLAIRTAAAFFLLFLIQLPCQRADLSVLILRCSHGPLPMGAICLHCIDVSNRQMYVGAVCHPQPSDRRCQWVSQMYGACINGAFGRVVQ